MNDETRAPGELPTDPGQECREAIALGGQFLTATNVDPMQYRLVKAENLIGQPEYRGPTIWRLTLKLRSLIPRISEEEIGAGGELFLEVDLATRDVRLLGHGE